MELDSVKIKTGVYRIESAILVLVAAIILSILGGFMWFSISDAVLLQMYGTSVTLFGLGVYKHVKTTLNGNNSESV